MGKIWRVEEREIDWKVINRIVLEVRIKKRFSNLIHLAICKKNSLWFLTGDKEILEKCKRFYPKIFSYIELKQLTEDLKTEKGK